MGGSGTKARVLQTPPRAPLPQPCLLPLLQRLPYFFTSKWVLLLDCRLSENLAEIFQVPGLRTGKAESWATHPQTAHGPRPPEEGCRARAPGM